MSEPRIEAHRHSRAQLALRLTECADDTLPWQYFNRVTVASIVRTALDALDERDQAMRWAVEIANMLPSSTKIPGQVLCWHDPADDPEFRTYAEIRDEPLPEDPTHAETMARVRQLTGQKKETE